MSVPRAETKEREKEALCEVLITDKRNAKSLKNLLEKHKIYNKKYRIKELENNDVAVPIDLKRFEEKKEECNLKDHGVKQTETEMLMPFSKAHLIKLETIQKSIKDEFVDLFYSRTRQSLTENQLKDLPTEWQIHGDLLLLPKDCLNLDIWEQVAPEMWDIFFKILNIKRIAKHSRISEDKFRSSKVELISGNDGWISRKENGIIYTYDISKCMFSDGNITEKLRIAKFDCQYETVVDLFAGIGYFVIPYLVHSKAKLVYACEWNPIAIEALKKNLAINNVAGRCVILEGDNRLVAPKNVADRVNLGLIPSSELSWPTACETLNHAKGGWLHIHANVNTSEEVISLGSTNSITKEDEKGQKNMAAGGTESESKNDISLEESKDPMKKSGDINSSLCRIFSDENKLGKTQESAKKEKAIIWMQWAEQTALKIKTLLMKCHKVDGLDDWLCSVHHVEHVKQYAPHIDHIVVDMECRPVYSK